MPLQKLMIKGIRSFSPATQNVIEFHTPFTLIVGPNGTGKTTIIESLKYALTGALPPNSKGGAFVYDPKILREPDVKAEIRLRFTDTSGRVLTVKRILQATQRGGKLSQKTLETELLVEQATHSAHTIMASKMTDVDSLVPSLIGSSSPLLDSVILCHQEDSSWPVAESRILKDRLDAIFCSTQYTKALKAMKDARRDTQTELKVLNERISQLSREKAQRDQLVSRLSQMTEEADTLNRKLSTFKAEKERILSVLSTLRKDEEIYSQLEKNYRTLMSEFDGCINFIKNFKHELLDKDKIRLLMLELNIDDISESDIETLRTAVIKRINEYEMIDIDEIEIEQQEVEKFTRLIESKHDISGKIDGSKNIIEKLIEKKDRLQGENQMTASKIKGEQEFKEEKRRLEDDLARCDRVEKRVKEYEKSNNEVILKYTFLDGDRRVLAGETESHDMNMSEEIELLTDEIGELDMEISESVEQLCAKQKMFNEGMAVQERKGVIEKEIAGLTEIEIGEYENLKAKKEQLEKSINKAIRHKEMINEEIQNIKRILHDYESNDVHDDLSSMMPTGGLNNTSKHNITTGNPVIKNVVEKIKFLKNLLEKLLNYTNEENTSGNITDKQENLENIINNLKGWVNEFDFHKCDRKEIETFMEEINTLKKQAAISSNAEAIYRNFKDIANSRKECPLCKNPLSMDRLDLFNKKLSNVIIKLPVKVGEIEGQIKALEERSVKAHEEMKRVEEESAAIQCIVAGVSNLLARVLDLKSLLEGGVGTLAGLYREHSEVSRRICKTDLDRERRESLLKDLQELKAKECSSTDDGSLLRKRVAVLKERKIELNRRVKQLKEKKDRRGVEEWLREVEELKTIDRPGIEDELKKVEERLGQIAGMRAECEIRSRQVNEIEREVKEEENKLTALKNLMRELEESINNDYSGIIKKYIYKYFNTGISGWNSEQSVNTLHSGQTLDIHIDRVLTGQGLTKNEEGLEIIKKLKERIQEIKKISIMNLREIKKLKDRLIVVDENIKLKNCKERVIKIEEEFGDFNMKKKQALMERIEQYRGKESGVNAKMAMIVGELKQNEMGMKGMREDLKRNYEKTNKEYAQAVVELRAYEMGIKETDLCIQSLDRAIVEYHRAKLEEVNATLQSLWSSTYCGGDIDTVELRSDSSDPRSCGYSLVMIKGGVAIDMRGRCSAGQRAIASILVRVALADSFSAGCNILALDEPTTNLDRANVAGLAEMLSSLVKKRRDMQLVVITHDEEFVRMLGSEELEHFYRLRRDSRSNSQIERYSVFSENVI